MEGDSKGIGSKKNKFLLLSEIPNRYCSPLVVSCGVSFVPPLLCRISMVDPRVKPLSALGMTSSTIFRENLQSLRTYQAGAAALRFAVSPLLGCSILWEKCGGSPIAFCFLSVRTIANGLFNNTKSTFPFVAQMFLNIDN